ncbi:GNAT family N-acetyltransferase [Bacillus infantis]|nr:GNAT family N-acetyltransferase [Bacillus infantis]
MGTERLNLRRLKRSDSQAIFDRWLSDERVAENRVSAAHRTVPETNARVADIAARYERKDFCWWGIELKATGELVGEIDLYDWDLTTGNCSVSYSLGYDWWNKGYATEALKAVMEFGFMEMDLHKIAAAHNTDNPASGKVMTKAGMKQEGIVRHMIRNAKGLYKDCVLYGILKEDFLKMNLYKD